MFKPYSISVGSIDEQLDQIFDNALCFSLYWPFVLFVFSTELITNDGLA